MYVHTYHDCTYVQQRQVKTFVGDNTQPYNYMYFINFYQMSPGTSRNFITAKLA